MVNLKNLHSCCFFEAYAILFSDVRSVRPDSRNAADNISYRGVIDMKKYLKSVTAFAAAALLAAVSAGNIQAANTYDAEIETVSGNYLFSGDTVRGVEPVYIGPDGEMAVLENGEWKNDTDKVYEMSG